MPPVEIWALFYLLALLSAGLLIQLLDSSKSFWWFCIVLLIGFIAGYTPSNSVGLFLLILLAMPSLGWLIGKGLQDTAPETYVIGGFWTKETLLFTFFGGVAFVGIIGNLDGARGFVLGLLTMVFSLLAFSEIERENRFFSGRLRLKHLVNYRHSYAFIGGVILITAMVAVAAIF